MHHSQGYRRNTCAAQFSPVQRSTAYLEAGAEAEYHVSLLRRLVGSVPVDGPGNAAPLPEVDDGVEQAGPADVAAPPRGVAVPVRPLRHVKKTDVRPHRLAAFANLSSKNVNKIMRTFSSPNDTMIFMK